MDHNGGSQAGFVGEDAPLHAPGQGHLDTVAHDAAAHGLKAEGALEDGYDDGGKGPHMGEYDDQGADDVGDGHEGNDLFRNGSNALKTADDDKACQDHEGDACNDGGDAEGGIHVCGNGIDLGHVADTKGRKSSQDAEKHSKPFPLRPHAVLNIVHRTANPVAMFIALTVSDGKRDLGVLDHHAKQGSHPEPEDCSVAAHGNCLGSSDDVAGADGCRKSCRDRLQRRDRASVGLLSLEHLADRVLHGIAKATELHRAAADGQEDTAHENARQQDVQPRDIVERAGQKLINGRIIN